MGECVIGGAVYRGAVHPALVGRYVYGDCATGLIWTLLYQGALPPTNALLLDGGGLPITSFGLDQNQEMYVLAFDGHIYRFE